MDDDVEQTGTYAMTRGTEAGAQCVTQFTALELPGQNLYAGFYHCVVNSLYVI